MADLENSWLTFLNLAVLKSALIITGLSFMATISDAQQPPFGNAPEVAPPVYRIRYEADPEGLIFPVKYTVWIPPNVQTLRGLIVHQHGCGEGSCKSGLTGAFDLHWQALAKKHDCALMAPSYEQPQKADCQMWCDPRNGSSKTFQKALIDLGTQSGHPELATVPWALWGHSGGGHWAGGMAILHPEKVAAVWLRSGVPIFEPNPDRTLIKPHELKDSLLSIPIMCNPGTKEGVTVKEGRFARVWPANERFLTHLRARDALVGVAIDPLTAHECGNQRYLSIPWFDVCLEFRLPNKVGDPLKRIPTKMAWLAPFLEKEAVAATEFEGDRKTASWLPNKRIAGLWMQFVTDTNVPDRSPPPAPYQVNVEGNVVTWKADADFESGIAHFIIKRDGKFAGRVPKKDANRFGRPIFQGLQYSDTPTQPLQKMRFVDASAKPDSKHEYQVIAVNTVGLRSK